MVKVEPSYFQDLVGLHLESRQFYPGSTFFQHLEELLKSWTDSLREQIWGEDEDPDLFVDEEIDLFLERLTSSDPTTREVGMEVLRPILLKVWNFIFPYVSDLELIILDSLAAMVRSDRKCLIILAGWLFFESQRLFLEGALYHEFAHLILGHTGKSEEFEENEANDLALHWF